MIRKLSIKLRFPGDGVDTDVSPLLREGSASFTLGLFGAEKRSVVDTFSFTLNHDQAVVTKIRSATTRIFISVRDPAAGDQILFTGWIEPNARQSAASTVGPVTLEAVDNSWRLDKPIAQSFCWPAIVSDPGYKLFDPADTAHSIFHQLLLMAGYTQAEISSQGTITGTVRSVSATKGSTTYRALLDDLFFEARNVFHFGVDGLAFAAPWTRDDGSFDAELDKSSFSIIEPVTWETRAEYKDGAKVEWSELAVIENALVYRESLPGNSEGQPTGIAIAPGGYYPPDSDIEEAYQSFVTTWLDIPYLTRNTRLKNQDLTLVATSNHCITGHWTADAGIVVDVETYEGHRSRVRFKNTSGAIAKLYTFEVYAKALIRKTIKSVTKPSTATDPRVFTSKFTFDSGSADSLTNAIALDVAYAHDTYSFGLNRLVMPGAVVRLVEPRNGTDTRAMITEVSFTANRPVHRYKAVALAGFQSLSAAKIAERSSEGPGPGLRSATLKLYKWANAAPTTWPAGVSTYTWATGAFTDPATLNGWAQNPPAGSAGQTLYVTTAYFIDSSIAPTSQVAWPTSGQSAAAIGVAGSNGASSPQLKSQYSVTGADGSWHDAYAASDCYMRTSADNGANWSVAIRIKGVDGATGASGAGTWTPITVGGVVKVDSQTFRKTSGASAYDNSRVYSKEGYQSCFVSFQVESLAGSPYTVGLNTDPLTDGDWTKIDYFWHPSPAGGGFVYTGAAGQVAQGPTYDTSTVFMITYDGTTVRFFQGGTLIHSITDPGKTFYLDSRMVNVPSGAVNLHFGPMGSKGDTGTNGINGADGKNGRFCINRDPYFEDGSQWESSGANGFTIGVVGFPAGQDNPEGRYCLYGPNGGASYVCDKNYYPIDRGTADVPGKSYRVRFWAYADTAGALVYFCLRQYKDNAGTLCDTNGGRSPYKPSPAALTSGKWTLFEYTWDSADWQAGMKYVRPDWLLNYDNKPGTVFISGFTLTEITRIGYVGEWTPILSPGMYCSDGHYRKTSGNNNSWDASVRSLEGLTSCTLQFSFMGVDGYKMVGLNSDPSTNNDYVSLDFCWYGQSGSALSIYENGAHIGNYGTYNSDTKLAITYDGYTVRYLKDGIVKRAVACTGATLYLDSSFYNVGTPGIYGVRFGKSLILTELVAGSITANEINTHNLFAQALTINSGGYLQSEDFAANPSSAGFRINADGSVVFNEAVIRGTIYASAGSFSGAIYASSGSISGCLTIGAGGYFSANSDKVRIHSTGIEVRTCAFTATPTTSDRRLIIDDSLVVIQRWNGSAWALSGSAQFSLNNVGNCFVGTDSYFLGFVPGSQYAYMPSALKLFELEGAAIKPARGVWPSSSLHGSITAGGLYDWISPYVPGVGDKRLLAGGVHISNVIVLASATYVERITTTAVRLYGLTHNWTNGTLDVASGSTGSGYASLAI